MPTTCFLKQGNTHTDSASVRKSDFRDRLDFSGDLETFRRWDFSGKALDRYGEGDDYCLSVLPSQRFRRQVTLTWSDDAVKNSFHVLAWGMQNSMSGNLS